MTSGEVIAEEGEGCAMPYKCRALDTVNPLHYTAITPYIITLYSNVICQY